MRKMVLFVDCGKGTRSASAFLVPESYTQEQLDEYSWEAALQHGESYGEYPEYDEDDGIIDDSNISGWFEEYDAKKHDCKLKYGCSNTFEWNEI